MLSTEYVYVLYTDFYLRRFFPTTHFLTLPLKSEEKGINMVLLVEIVNVKPFVAGILCSLSVVRWRELSLLSVTEYEAFQ